MENKMRTSNVPLYAELAREHRRSEGATTCEMCKTGQVEDQTHMLLACDAYENARRTLHEAMEKEKLTNEWRAHEMKGGNALVQWLLSDPRCDVPIKRFLGQAWRVRYATIMPVGG